jgi:hypothetical protein
MDFRRLPFPISDKRRSRRSEVDCRRSGIWIPKCRLTWNMPRTSGWFVVVVTGFGIRVHIQPASSLIGIFRTREWKHRLQDHQCIVQLVKQGNLYAIFIAAT